jgi:hypothetical protein
MTKSTPTLTQSGLLAVLLQRQRYRVFQLARRSAHGKRVHAAFWNTFTWARRALMAPKPVDAPSPHLNLHQANFARAAAALPPNSMSHQIHNYTELRQQIHDDLRIKYPEWVEPNGESSMCLMEVLDTLTRRGTQQVNRYSASRLRTESEPNRHPGGVIHPEVN